LKRPTIRRLIETVEGDKKKQLKREVAKIMCRTVN